MSSTSRRLPIFQLLSSNGDGTGTADATGNYSSTPLSLKCSRSYGWAHIARMIVMIQDGGTFDAELYGNGIVLTNGIRVYVKNASDAVLWEMTSFPIISNSDWAGHCHDYNYSESIGVGDSVASIRWTFDKAGQQCIVKFDQGEYLEVYLNDDFSGLTHHRFTVQGHHITAKI